MAGSPNAWPRVRVITDAGDILIELYPDRASATVAAFLAQVDAGAYNGGNFGRVVRPDNDQGIPPIEIVQASAARADDPLRLVAHESTELTGLSHRDGAVSLPRAAGDGGTPLGFFVSIGDQPALDHGGERIEDGLGFAVFGQVVAGREVLRIIQSSATLPDAPIPYLRGQIIADPVIIHLIRREAENATALLDELAGDYWAFRVREFPIEASGAGVKSAARLLDHGRIADHARHARLCAVMLGRAREIAAGDLPPQAAVTLSLLVGQLESVVSGFEVRSHLMPQLYPFGFADALTHLAQSTTLGSLQDLDDFGARLAAVPGFMAEQMETLAGAFSSGYRLPRLLVPRILGLVDAQLSANGLARVISARIGGVIAGADPAAVAAHRAHIGDLVDKTVLPELLRFREMIAGLDQACLTDNVSIADQPGGREYYRYKVRQQTTTMLSPDEIHAIGIDEVRRIQADLDSLLIRMGRAGKGGAVAAELNGRIAASGEALLTHVRATAKRIDGLIPRLVGCMPRITYGVDPFTEAQSRDLPPALAQPSPADRSTPGIFWLTALPERCPLHLVIPLALHEAWPGHLMQLAIAQELDDLPAFRRYGWTDYNGYVEGWALYCEGLGHDLGLYDDPADHFGQISFDLWRAARLVVDTGLHWMGWSREDAIGYMAGHTFLPQATIEAEIDRYIGMPAQALSYKIGERSLRALREAAVGALGSDFSLRDFHDAVLATGPVSLSALEEHVHRWIAQRGRRDDR